MSTINEIGTRAYRKRILDVVEAGLCINFFINKRYMRLIADDGQDLTQALGVVLHIPFRNKTGGLGIRIGLDPEDSVKAFVFELNKILPKTESLEWRIVGELQKRKVRG